MSDTGGLPIEVDHAASARREQMAKDVARAKDAGWSNPVPFNYPTVGGGEPAPDETRETAGWLSQAVIYQWDDDFGDVGEPNPRVEEELFCGDHMQRAGTAVKALEFDVGVDGPEKVHPVRSVSQLSFAAQSVHLLTAVQFEDAGLHPIMLENVKLSRYHVPTPIQSYCIPAVLTGHDVVAIAQTGEPFDQQTFTHPDTG
jgi:ATP-dependent RNA helicase DDX3X